MIQVGQTIQGKEILEVKELPHKDDSHLKLVFCKYRNEYVSFLYNADITSFNHGRYADDYDQGMENFKAHCEYYNIK